VFVYVDGEEYWGFVGRGVVALGFVEVFVVIVFIVIGLLAALGGAACEVYRKAGVGFGACSDGS
jgi:hypothetical protein